MAVLDQDQWLQLPAAENIAIREQGLRPVAVLLSVLLHLGLLAGFGWFTQPDPEPPAVAVPLHTPLSISIASNNPQRRSATVSTPDGTVGTPAEAAITSTFPASTLPATPPESTPLSPLVSNPSAETEPRTEGDLPAATVATPAESATGTSITPTLDGTALQAMIANVVQQDLATRQQQAQEECQRYRNRYPTRECPPVEETRFASQELTDELVTEMFTDWVTGYDRNERITQELLDDMDRLRPLMATEGVLATLAAERYFLKKDQFIYLNGDTAQQTHGGEPIMTIMTFSPKGIVLLGGLLTLEFDGTIKTLSAPTFGPAKHFSEAAPVHNAQEETAPAFPEFKVQASALPVSRQ